MNHTKAIIDFTDYSATELGTIAKFIHDKFVENAATFTGLPFTMATFLTLIGTYNTQLVARGSKATADILGKGRQREPWQLEQWEDAIKGGQGLPRTPPPGVLALRAACGRMSRRSAAAARLPNRASETPAGGGGGADRAGAGDLGEGSGGLTRIHEG